MKSKVFFRCCIKYWSYFLSELILSYVLSFIVVKGNTMIGDAIDTMLTGEYLIFSNFFVVLLLLTMAGFMISFLESVFASKFSIKVQTAYKNIVANKLYRLQYRYFDKNGTASIINKMNADIAEADALLNQDLPTICTNLVSMITYAVYVGRINLRLLILMLVCYPLIFYFTNKIVKKIECLKKVFRQKTDLITEISQDCVSGILVLRAFGAENYFQEKLNRAADDLVENEAKRTRISNSALVVRKILQWMPNIICAVYAYVMVLRSSISIGELIVFLMILQRFVDAFVELPFAFVDTREHLVCIERIEEILAQPDELSGEKTVGLDTDVAIAFEHVGFSYVESREVLKDLSFEIKKNSSVAFVGDSGGGKSTIFHLLCGFYPVNSGTYKLFGREFGDWDIEAARNHMALVSQDVFLFPTSIMENVRYGNARASDEQIIEACKNARIHDFIMGLPEKYDTIVGERGILLSGGERQRISIARAFLKDAPLLLLDEPTSAVDVATEKLIQEALDKLSKDKTCITIAHRLSTIRNADKIMLLKNGMIVENGTHEELLKCNGIYANMYGKEIENQRLKTEEAAETKRQ